MVPFFLLDQIINYQLKLHHPDLSLFKINVSNIFLGFI